MPKAKRIAYDAKFKLEAIALAEEQGNRRTASELGINESMVRKWRRQKGELRACEKRMKAFRACKARWPELEAKLADWIQIPRADGRELTTAQIRLKAIEMAKSAGITDFTGNVSWFFRFMKRHNLAKTDERKRKKVMRQDTEFAPDMKVEIDVAADASLLTEGHGTSADTPGKQPGNTWDGSRASSPTAHSRMDAGTGVTPGVIENHSQFLHPEPPSQSGTNVHVKCEQETDADNVFIKTEVEEMAGGNRWTDFQCNPETVMDGDNVKTEAEEMADGIRWADIQRIVKTEAAEMADGDRWRDNQCNPVTDVNGDIIKTEVEEMANGEDREPEGQSVDDSHNSYACILSSQQLEKMAGREFPHSFCGSGCGQSSQKDRLFFSSAVDTNGGAVPSDCQHHSLQSVQQGSLQEGWSDSQLLAEIERQVWSMSREELVEKVLLMSRMQPRTMAHFLGITRFLPTQSCTDPPPPVSGSEHTEWLGSKPSELSSAKYAEPSAPRHTEPSGSAHTGLSATNHTEPSSTGHTEPSGTRRLEPPGTRHSGRLGTRHSERPGTRHSGPPGARYSGPPGITHTEPSSTRHSKPSVTRHLEPSATRCRERLATKHIEFSASRHLEPSATSQFVLSATSHTEPSEFSATGHTEHSATMHTVAFRN